MQGANNDDDPHSAQGDPGDRRHGYRRASLFTATFATAAALVAGTFYGHVPLLVWALFAVIALPPQSGGVSPQPADQAAVQDLQVHHAGDVPNREGSHRSGDDLVGSGSVCRQPGLEEAARHSGQHPLSAEEQAFMDGPVEEVCRMVNDWEVTHERADLSPEVWQYLKDNKFFAMIIKKKYGGLEFSAYAQSCVLQKAVRRQRRARLHRRRAQLLRAG